MPIAWPLFSPNSNPTESVRHQMKIHIDGHHPEEYAGGQRSINKLHEIVIDVWNSISSVQISGLIYSMPDARQCLTRMEVQ